MTSRAPLFSYPPRSKPRDPEEWKITYAWGLLGQDRLPFRQADWPVPKGRPPLNLSWTGWYDGELIGRDQFPFRIRDWPLHARDAPPAAQDWISGLNLSLLVPAQRPFSQYDWPLPQAAPWPHRSVVDRPVFLAYEFLDLFYGDPGQVLALDWPLTPGPRQPADYSYISNAYAALYPPPPFNQLVWPSPQARWFWA